MSNRTRTRIQVLGGHRGSTGPARDGLWLDLDPDPSGTLDLGFGAHGFGSGGESPSACSGHAGVKPGWRGSWILVCVGARAPRGVDVPILMFWGFDLFNLMIFICIAPRAAASACMPPSAPSIPSPRVRACVASLRLGCCGLIKLKILTLIS